MHDNAIILKSEWKWNIIVDDIVTVAFYPSIGEHLYSRH